MFLRDGCGDIDTFRFLWSRMPHQIPPIKVSPVEDSTPIPNQTSYDAIRLAALSTLRFAGSSIPGGDITQLWAFASLGGRRVLFVMAESELSDKNEEGSTEKTLHVRGDDKILLSCLTGSTTARKSLLSCLTGMTQS